MLSVAVEYQNKPLSCSHCKSFGHSFLRCPNANFKWDPKVVSSTHTPTAGETSASPVNPSPPPTTPSGSWTLVAKGPKLRVGPTTPFGPSDSYLFNLLSPVAAGPLDCFSDTDVTLSPNPLMGKLKLIDEKEVRDLKHKAAGSLDVGQASKKKIKGGGARSPLLNIFPCL